MTDHEEMLWVAWAFGILEVLTVVLAGVLVWTMVWPAHAEEIPYSAVAGATVECAMLEVRRMEAGVYRNRTLEETHAHSNDCSNANARKVLTFICRQSGECM